MAIIDTLRGFATAVVGRSNEQEIEAAIQAFYADLHTLVGLAVPTQTTTTTTVTTVVAAAPEVAPEQPVQPTTPPTV